jgi:cytochrome c oxidase subunit III
MSTEAPGGYYVPQPSYWPIVGSCALLLMASGGVLLMNGVARLGWVPFGLGIATLVFMLVGWFGKVIGESEGGKYNAQVDLSFRWSMSWFIFSEVMFFAAFFGALYYARQYSVPWLGDLDNAGQLWHGYEAQWPTAGPGLAINFSPMAAWGIPAINTLLLLSSGVTVTWAHWALKKNNRSQLILGLFLTIALGLTFLGLQVHEYGEAYKNLNLTLAAGVYGATFFMLTGFHGFHVTIGTIMLIVVLLRSIKGHFSPEHHFAFEAVSWYWHFVDIVWLGLFIFVYWLV